MAARQWQLVNRKDNVQEYFMEDKFITSDNWLNFNPPKFKNEYKYMKDVFTFCGQECGSNIEKKIHVTKFIHATSCNNAASIIKDGGFRPGEVKTYDGVRPLSLIWFGLKVGGKQIDLVREEYRRCAYDQLQQAYPDLQGNADSANNLAKEFANTPPFQPMSRYGTIKFTPSIKEVFLQYRKQFCENDNPGIKKLGTFAYKRELMHAVLVCRPHIFNNHSELNDGLISINNYETCIWKPDSSSDNGKIRFGQNNRVYKDWYKRWEHVAFAFQVLPGDILKIDDLNKKVSLCLHHVQELKTFKIVCIHNAIFNMLQIIQNENVSGRRETLAKMLISMIIGYRKEWPLYQKTVKEDTLNDVIGEKTVEDDWVKSSFKAMLPKEFSSLDWSSIIVQSR